MKKLTAKILICIFSAVALTFIILSAVLGAKQRPVLVLLFTILAVVTTVPVTFFSLALA